MNNRRMYSKQAMIQILTTIYIVILSIVTMILLIQSMVMDLDIPYIYTILKIHQFVLLVGFEVIGIMVLKRLRNYSIEVFKAGRLRVRFSIVTLIDPNHNCCSLRFLCN
jgi:hypothetical protein